MTIGIYFLYVFYRRDCVMISSCIAHFYIDLTILWVLHAAFPFGCNDEAIKSGCGWDNRIEAYSCASLVRVRLTRGDSDLPCAEFLEKTFSDHPTPTLRRATYESMSFLPALRVSRMRLCKRTDWVETSGRVQRVVKAEMRSMRVARFRA